MVATFERILIAVDDSPIAARAANVAFYLARALQGDVALITVVDLSQNCLPESGIPTAAQIVFAEDAKLLAEIGARSDMQPRPLGFTPVGKPADKIVDAAKGLASRPDRARQSGPRRRQPSGSRQRLGTRFTVD